jgi:hypothetical protein
MAERSSLRGASGELLCHEADLPGVVGCCWEVGVGVVTSIVVSSQRSGCVTSGRSIVVSSNGGSIGGVGIRIRSMGQRSSGVGSRGVVVCGNGSGGNLQRLLVNVGLGRDLDIHVGLSGDLDINIGLSRKLLVDIGLSLHLRIYIRLSRDLHMDVGLSQGLLVEVGLGQGIGVGVGN